MFDTFKDATNAVVAIFGEVRSSDPHGQPFASERENVVAVFKPGKYVQMDLKATQQLLARKMPGHIQPYHTDTHLSGIFYAYETEANSMGFAYDHALYDLLVAYRNSLLAPARKIEINNVISLFNR
jgi:hypothetical protein